MRYLRGDWAEITASQVLTNDDLVLRAGAVSVQNMAATTMHSKTSSELLLVLYKTLDDGGLVPEIVSMRNNLHMHVPPGICLKDLEHGLKIFVIATAVSGRILLL